MRSKMLRVKSMITLNCQLPKAKQTKAKASSFGIKLRVISLIDVAAWTMPMITPTARATISSGAQTMTETQSACRPNSMTVAVSMRISYQGMTKLEAREPMIKPQPSTKTKSISLKGIEIIIGDNIIMPIDISTLDTIRSMTTNGI